VQSVPVVSSNPVHGEVYSIKHYVIKFISDLRHVSPVFSTNKTDRHELTEIELKVALSTINLTKTYNTPGLIFRPETLTSIL
jgi:hypothetical protein